MELVELPVEHEGEVEDAVEERHEQVGQTQIDQEVIGDGAHATVRCN